MKDIISPMSRVCNNEFDKVIYILSNVIFVNKKLGKLNKFLRRFK